MANNFLDKRLTALAFLYTALLGLVPGVSAQDAAVVPVHTHKPTIAIALGGGGGRAAAEIGVLRVLEKAGIKPDYVVGTSMGAVIGSLYCAGVPLDKIENLMLSRKGVFHAFIPSSISLRLVGHGPAFVAHAMHLRKEIGLWSGKDVVSFINASVPADQRLVENLKPKFSTVAVNLLDSKLVTIDKGDLGQAVYASSALPGLFRASRYYPDQVLIDGGWRANVPVRVAKAMGADIVIGVNADEKLMPVSGLDLKEADIYVNRLTTIIMEEMDLHQMEAADVQIWPVITDMSIFSRSEKGMARCVKRGEAAAEASLPELQKKIDKLTY
jgi:NTE family protein